MNDCIHEHELHRFQAHELDEKEAARIRRHLAECPTCARRNEQLAQEQEALQARMRNLDLDTTEVIVGGAGKHNGPPHPRGKPEIPGYEILRRLGGGGQGDVYEALEIAASRKVAIKILRDNLDASRCRDFDREIKVLARLDHVNIVPVFHCGETQRGERFCVMKYVRGPHLDDYVRDKNLPLNDRLELMRRTAEAVEYAHERAIIHRDLKPSNVLVDAEGQPKILDFGLAKIVGGPEESLATGTGQLLGTLPYMSPEQTRGNPDEIDKRTDVYSLGVMLYEILTGDRPYSVNCPLSEALNNITEFEPKRPSAVRPDIPREVDTIVVTALAKDRARRYASAGALAKDIENHLTGQPLQAVPVSLSRVAIRRLKRTASRNPVGSCAVTVLLAFLVGCFLLATGLLVSWPDRKFRTTMRALLPLELPEEIRFIALDDATHKHLLPELQEKYGIEGVDPEDNKSLRVLHGALMKRLADVAPQIVAWDIKFESCVSEFDDALAEGFDELRNAGTEVFVIAARVDNHDSPSLCDTFAERVDGWGMHYLEERDDGVVDGVTLASDKSPHDVFPSISLRVFAEQRNPDCDPEFFWHHGHQRLGVRYTLSDPEQQTPSRRRPETDFVDILDPKERDEGQLKKGTYMGTALGVRRDAYYAVSLPSAEALARSTMSYRDVLGRDLSEVRDFLKDKIVFISDNRVEHSADRFGADRAMCDTADGVREEFGCYMHGAALGSMMKDAGLLRPGFRIELILMVSAVIMGTGIGTLPRPPVHVRRIVWLLAGASAVFLSIAVFVAIRYRMIIPPTSVLLVIWLCGLGVARIRALQARPADSLKMNKTLQAA